MEIRLFVSSQGVAKGFFGFSMNSTMRRSPSTPMTPKREASSMGIVRVMMTASVLGLAEKEEQLAVVGIVDVVARKDQDGFRVLLLDGVDILEHCVRGALVPVVADAALGGQGDDVIAALGVEDVPAVEDMAFEGQGFVLRQESDPAQAGVERVRQAEIDDPVGAEERNRRLGPVPGQGVEPLPLAPAEDHDQGLLR